MNRFVFLFFPLLFLSCKKEVITTETAAQQFGRQIQARWKFVSYSKRVIRGETVLQEGKPVSLNPASSFTFRPNGKVTVINFGVSQFEADYRVLSGNEFSINTPDGEAYCYTDATTFTSARFIFSAQVNNSDGSTTITTYNLADRTAL